MKKLNEVQALALGRKVENYSTGLNAEAVYGLITRVFGQKYADFFVLEGLEGDGFDRFSLEDTVVNGEARILLRATSGTAAGSALRWYLQERCGSYIGPLTRRMNLPENPPAVGGKYENESPFLYRYFLNYCTFSYSFVFWTWKEWEPFLDWAMLSGYNLILNTVGAEWVWSKTLQKMGYTLEEARRFLTAPAFFSWQCALNITGWIGAAPESWYEGRAELSRKITQRLNSLGARVVLPAYCGIIPNDFGAHFPEAKVLEQGLWCNFQRPALLPPEDPLFDRMAENYYASQQEMLGQCTAYFGAIPFHEGGKSERINLTHFAQNCHAHMKRVHPTAVWVLEGWGDNPKREMLNALNTEDVLVINLRSQIALDGGDNFANKPWILGGVNNFGGVRVLRCNLDWQYETAHATVQDENHTMVGCGLLPEGVEMDECCFDLYADIMFRRDLPGVANWQTEYLKHRYGMTSPALERAWDALRREVYRVDTQGNLLGSALCSQPSLTVQKYTPCCESVTNRYHPQLLIDVVQDLISEKEALWDCRQYRFDLTEVLRQLVALTSWGVVNRLQDAYRDGDLEAFEDAAEDLMQLFDFQSKVMADNPAPDLWQRLEMAERHGTNPLEKLYFGFQLKTQFTTWGDRAAFEVLHDYSNRELSGMLEHFYRPRWERYINYLRMELMCPRLGKDADMDYPQFDTDRAFCLSVTPAKDKPTAENLEYVRDLLAACRKMYEKRTPPIGGTAGEHDMEAG